MMSTSSLMKTNIWDIDNKKIDIINKTQNLSYKNV